MGEMRNAYTILIGKSEGKRSPGKPTSRWSERHSVWGCGLYCSGSEQGLMAASCQHDVAGFGFIKSGKFLHRPNDYKVLKKKTLLYSVSLTPMISDLWCPTIHLWVWYKIFTTSTLNRYLWICTS